MLLGVQLSRCRRIHIWVVPLECPLWHLMGASASCWNVEPMKPLRTVLTDYLKYKIQRNHREAMRRRNRERRRLAEDDVSEQHSHHVSYS